LASIAVGVVVASTGGAVAESTDALADVKKTPAS
jgi:hypothetical protein